ncbi:MAG: glycosyltransferase family 2 protein [Anaerolineae bacterium]|nr:glycosyltransferase family 2 protein [Anaerolineae bacterium]
MLDLGIVIVNYNTRDLLRECLKSVYANKGDFSYEVCVVDNCSADGSCRMVRAEFPQVHLIESPVNGGYAYANNLGLRHFGFGQRTPDAERRTPNPEPRTPNAERRTPPCYALLLNPDTELPPTALADMLAFMDGHPDAGIAGPKLVRQDGSLDLACRRSFPSPEVSAYRMLGLSRLFPKSRRFGRYNLTCEDPDQLTEVDSVVGAFMMVRREAIEQAGLLDEAFFMYGEDLDWAYRIKQHGWRVWYNPAVTVLHIKEAASKHSHRARVEFWRAMSIFYHKHYAAETPRWQHGLVLAGIAVFGRLDLWKRALRSHSRRQQAQEAV